MYGKRHNKQSQKPLAERLFMTLLISIQFTHKKLFRTNKIKSKPRTEQNLAKQISNSHKRKPNSQ